MSNEFTYRDSREISHTIEIDSKDFELVQEHEILTDQKMQSKPTTFFRDAMKRFRKNKSSVVGGCILGALVLLSIVLPLALTSDVSDGVYANAYQGYLAPKLFEAGTGFWDGCTTVNDAILTIDYDHYQETGEVVGMPSSYKESSVVGGQDGVTYTGFEYASGYSASAYGGYVRIYGSSATRYPTLVSQYFDVDVDTDQGYKFEVTTASYQDLPEASSWNFGAETPYMISLGFTLGYGSTVTTVPLMDDYSTDYGTVTINLWDHIDDIKEAIGDAARVTNFHLRVSCEPSGQTTSSGGVVAANVLLQSAIIASNEEDNAEYLAAISFDDANTMFGLAASDTGYWAVDNCYRAIYQSRIFRGSFRFDTYDNALGDYTATDVGYSNLVSWVNRGWMKADTDMISTDALAGLSRSQVREVAAQFAETIEIISDRCPLVDDGNITVSTMNSSVVVGGTVTRWKALFPDADKCPSYLFGTDANGKDLLKYVAEGLRTSLILGVVTFLFCFTFGLVYGAIAGYYGGWVDIIMERITDILGGVPWIVVMTLAIIMFGSNFVTFALALCLTGWIGTSSRTRTQFYRYKNREYILAARTLGASDGRLIFRHILPNAIGTIVTSSVLMIPSVIYSEATLAYLNLGLQGMSSFGVILSDNQAYIKTYPYMILFPAAVMALMMISFNLFGNGLRDAFNPSLKGAEN